ncbi:S9 family peptidase [Asticcacaulis sp. BYS171W]|uniref:S9 family peptidase n=1 Tax=Asticcacaulis aquaticus TaxID=2984212 RepID=A0ABT5HPY2_9CAUL|nr:S9 family peptidase [Asticcacaulis aquaticus]MDC7681997.1 S9 family peptidase [Asticcacaulis aquaticus]
MTRTTIDRRTVLASMTAVGAVNALPQPASAANALGTPPPLEIFGDLPGLDHVTLSKDGRQVAMVSGRGTARSLIAFDLSTQKLLKQPVGNLKLRSLEWIDDSHILIESSATSSLANLSDTQAEWFMALSLNMQTGKAKPLYDNMADYFPVLGSGASVVRKGDKASLMAVGITRVKYQFILNRFDPETGRASQVDEGGPDTREWAFTREGTLVARQNYRRDTYTWSLEMNRGGWKTVLTEVEKIDTPNLVGIGRTTDTAVVYFNKGKLADQYVEVDMNGKLTPLFEDATQTKGLLRHPATGVIAGTYTYPGWIKYDYTDPLLKPLPQMIEAIFSGYRTQITGLAQDGRKTIIYSEGPDDAGTYFFIDFESGQNLRLGQAYPDLPAAWIAEKQAITYKAADGLEIEAYLTLPPGRDKKNLPLIVLPHGGPQARDDLSFGWDVNAYASRGYAVLQPNFRGSGGYGTAFVEKGYGEWGRKMQTDLSDGVRHLADKGIIDPKRVAIVGYSYGGYAAMAAAAFDNGIYRCAASYAGVSDLKSMIAGEGRQSGDANSDAIRYWKRYLGDEARWDSISPLKNADKVTIPLLLMHGKDDTVVEYIQSKQMADALQKAGKPVEFVTLTGEDHWLSRDETRLQMLKTILAFVEKYNPAY